MVRPNFDEDSFVGDDQSDDVDNSLDDSTFINNKDSIINISGDNNVINVYI